jgi:hypothetical protein
MTIFSKSGKSPEYSSLRAVITMLFHACLVTMLRIRDIFTDPDADPGGPKTYGSGSGIKSP